MGARDGSVGDNHRPADSSRPEPFPHGIEEFPAANDVVGAVGGGPRVSPWEVESDGVHGQATLTRSSSA
jgi:hypothetical protein